LKSDHYLVMAHGSAEESARARTVLESLRPARLDVHEGEKSIEPAAQPVYA
jgi:hypothetical protein